MNASAILNSKKRWRLVHLRIVLINNNNNNDDDDDDDDCCVQALKNEAFGG